MTPQQMRKIRRRELDMTQKDLANALGLTLKTIGNYESGRQRIPLIVQLALIPLRHNAQTETQ